MSSSSSTRDQSFEFETAEGYEKITSHFKEPVSLQAYKIVYEGITFASSFGGRKPRCIMDTYHDFLDCVFLRYGIMAGIMLREMEVATNADFFHVLKQMILAGVLTLSLEDEFAPKAELNETFHAMIPFDANQVDFKRKYEL